MEVLAACSFLAMNPQQNSEPDWLAQEFVIGAASFLVLLLCIAVV